MKLQQIAMWAPVFGLACTTPPYQEPFSATVLQPSAGHAIVVDQTLTILDSSGSIGEDQGWSEDKALFESYVAGMPEGTYRAGAINFGGKRRQTASLGQFDRARLATHAREARYFANATPLEDVLRESADQLEGAGGRAAVVLFSDGVPTVDGKPRTGDAELEAARELVERHGGTVCFHAVQTGISGDGNQFLEKLTQVTSCGSLRDAASISNAPALAAFQSQVFTGVATRTATPIPGDQDGDGVLDNLDVCAGTPLGASVDGRGCWVLTNLRFGTDSFAIDPAGLAEVDKIAMVLAQNPGLRIGVDGHTDNTGSAAYNQSLSEKRAGAVRDRLVEQGIDSSRLEVRGFGEAKPATTNDTREGRLQNRRIEFSVLR